jgi:hypothetical protein
MVVTPGVFKNTVMSPEEHSRRHRQRTIREGRVREFFLPVISSQPPRSTKVTAGVFLNTLMSPMEHSRKHRQRTDPQKKGAGKYLPVELAL